MTHNYGGLEFKDPSTEVVIKYICIKDIFYKNDLLKSVNPLILWHQYVSGLSTLTLETSHQVPKYVTSILLKKIIILLNKHNLQIKLKQAFIQSHNESKTTLLKTILP